ncbi:hypothetical protein EGW08_004512, partial [Elysia chlorotica]
MSKTKVVGGIDPDRDAFHPNHNGVGSVSPDDHHHDNAVDTNLDLGGHDDDYRRQHDQPYNNNRSGQSSAEHELNGQALETQPRYLLNSNRGKVSNFYVNGDWFFPRKRVVHNPKHFKDLPHYLDYLTDRLEPRFGAIRKICTPRRGHRVLSLQDIRENCDYVVV